MFSLNLSGECAYPAGAQEGRHLRFPPSDFLPFPLRVWRRFPICDRCEKGNGSRVTLVFVSQNIRSSQTAYCYTGGLINARRGMTVPRKSLARCNARHLRIKRLVQFIFVGPVYNNALKDRAALLCRACGELPVCVAERYLTLRTGCSRGRTPKVVRP